MPLSTKNKAPFGFFQISLKMKTPHPVHCPLSLPATRGCQGVLLTTLPAGGTLPSLTCLFLCQDHSSPQTIPATHLHSYSTGVGAGRGLGVPPDASRSTRSPVPAASAFSPPPFCLPSLSSSGTDKACPALHAHATVLTRAFQGKFHPCLPASHVELCRGDCRHGLGQVGLDGEPHLEATGQGAAGPELVTQGTELTTFDWSF